MCGFIMDNYSFGYIKDLLTKEGLDVTIESEIENVPMKHLRLNLGQDYKKRPLSAYIILDQEQIDKKLEAKSTVFLQIWMVFPFHFIDEMVSEVGRYLLLVNKSLAFPGFGLSEPDRSLYFKYTLTFPEGNINISLLNSFIGLVMFFYDTFSKNIEEIASGNKSLLESVSI